MSDEAGRRWMTYAEIAEVFGLPSAKAGEARARRAKWERTIGNDGLAKVGVPVSAINAPRPRRRGIAGAMRRPTEGDTKAPTTPDPFADLRAQAEALRRIHEGVVADYQQRLGRAERDAVEAQDRATQERESRQAAEERARVAEAELARLNEGSWLRRAIRAAVR